MSRSVRRTFASLSLAVLATATLTACGGDEPADFETEQPTAEQTTEAAESDSADQEPEDKDPLAEDKDEDQTAAASGSAVRTVAGPEDAIETAVFDVPGADERDEATVTVGLHSLRVEGEVMVLELSITPEFRGDDTMRLWHMFGNSRVQPVLNDRENLKQYTVIGSQGGNTGWATDDSGNGHRYSSGQTVSYTAHFAAPEDDIDTINVSVNLVEFPDVTIER
ncbi:hypothetical protein [Georgenia satyanarayanai]|uniref:hypothetical protein n=1 Tax=Georgenia satyanarayanai TaxID=860221 RepID=UPI00126565D2|nr:hypothetical protein [Georgenia satyanarayanai]